MVIALSIAIIKLVLIPLCIKLWHVYGALKELWQIIKPFVK